MTSDLNERTARAEVAVGKALYEFMTGGYDVIDTTAGITLIAPLEDDYRDVFVVRVVPVTLVVPDVE